MINVTDVLHDPDIAQTFYVHRKSGEWVAGRFVQTNSDEARLKFHGVVTVASDKDLQQVPEGDRVKGAMCFITDKEIYVTREDNTSGTSDEVEWRGCRYKINAVAPWFDYGYNKAIGSRIKGK